MVATQGAVVEEVNKAPLLECIGGPLDGERVPFTGLEFLSARIQGAERCHEHISTQPAPRRVAVYRVSRRFACELGLDYAAAFDYPVYRYDGEELR